MKNTTVKTGSRSASISFLNGDSALASYMNDIGKFKTLSKLEERDLTARIQSGDKKAIKLLVEANLKFVVAVCRNYQNQGMPMGDLISEGNLGLIRAAQRFDGNMDFKFISYAVWWIRQGILTALAEQARVLNISPGKVNLIHKIGKATLKLSQKLGRQPLMSEVAEDMNITEKEIDICRQLAKAPLSLSRPALGEEGGNPEDLIPDLNTIRPDGPVRERMMAKNMERMLQPLPEREGEIIRLFYGIGAQRSLTLTELGVRFDLTRERIRQIKESGLRKLRHPSRAKQLSAMRD